MTRNYKDTKTVLGRKGLSFEFQKIRKGLKIVHIGSDVWRVGKIGSMLDPSTRLEKHGVPLYVQHQVIYGPDNKEYHLYGNDVHLTSLEFDKSYESFDRDQYKSHVNRHGNISIESSVKIYILTSILDKRENWCFDLKQTPNIGKLKVICHNGTIKNIEFDGVFKDIEITSGHYINEKPLSSSKMYTKTVTPVAFRVC